MPIIVSDPQSWQNLRKTLAGSIGFVPTMGHLHEGHGALCERARQENDVTVVSIFVNPTQFNQPSDFDRYQRSFDADCRLLDKARVDYVFYPDKTAIYPDNYEIRVTETVISRELEGEFRPGHFEGMMTVVLKLLNIIAPTRAYFGEKDFQQLLLVEKMVKALFLPVDIVRCLTVRAADGLALSSRNGRLDDAARLQAADISRFLKSDLGDDEVARQLKARGFRPEYVTSRWGRRLAAAWLGEVRLIDNVTLSCGEDGEDRHAVVS